MYIAQNSYLKQFHIHTRELEGNKLTLFWEGNSLYSSMDVGSKWSNFVI